MSVTIERSIGPDSDPELLEFYETYGWWADRRGEGWARNRWLPWSRIRGFRK